jgi:peptide/nickel transport system permease protein
VSRQPAPVLLESAQGADGWSRRHPTLALTVRRGLLGVITLFIVSLAVFFATLVLPGNAAYAILGQTASPQRVAALEEQLNLNSSPWHQYTTWLGGLLTGHFGDSLVAHESVWTLAAPRLVNSFTLMVIAGIVATILGVGLGALSAIRRDGVFDHLSALAALAITALPEFVVAIGLVMLFSTSVFHLLPAVSLIPPGTHAWQWPSLLVLPVLTLVLVTVPYIFRMTRAALIEALESDYVEMAVLKGVPLPRLVVLHALPNALPAIVQVIGLTFLYLAGGIVIVENVFNFPGIGQALVNAVANRDVPLVQFIVIVLAAFYVLTNIVSDVVALLCSPRRRTSEST